MMPKRFRLKRPELAQEVAAALADCQDVKAHQRLLAMRMAASGQFTSQQIAEQLGISRRRFFDWVKTVKSSGLAGLLNYGHGGGAVPRVAGKVLTGLKQALVTGRWKRAKEIQQWLKQQHEQKLSLDGVYYWLGKLGGVLKVPRKTHAQKDADQGAEFQRTLCAKLKN